jgi:hypothetical protein
MLISDIEEYAGTTSGSLSEKDGKLTFEVIVAERKALLAKKKLTYIFKFRIDDRKKELRYTEMLKESGSGLSSGGDLDSTSGFGFKTEKYSTSFRKPREGTIEEQSNLFGKQYNYVFNFSTFRGKIAEIAKAHDYVFSYHLTSAGI